MPWYMDPSTACVDCQRGEGCSRDVERFHRMHQRIIGDYLLEAWFLLMNGIFLFMARELGLGGIHDLLGYVVAHNLYPNIFRFSEDELFFFRDFDRRSGLEDKIKRSTNNSSTNNFASRSVIKAGTLGIIR